MINKRKKIEKKMEKYDELVRKEKDSNAKKIEVPIVENLEAFNLNEVARGNVGSPAFGEYLYENSPRWARYIFTAWLILFLFDVTLLGLIVMGYLSGGFYNFIGEVISLFLFIALTVLLIIHIRIRNRKKHTT